MVSREKTTTTLRRARKKRVSMLIMVPRKKEMATTRKMLKTDMLSRKRVRARRRSVLALLTSRVKKVKVAYLTRERRTQR